MHLHVKKNYAKNGKNYSKVGLKNHNRTLFSVLLLKHGGNHRFIQQKYKSIPGI